MVVKEDGHMVTARQEPRLVLVSITLENNYLTLEAPGMDPMVLPIKLPSSNTIHDCRCAARGAVGKLQRTCGFLSCVMIHVRTAEQGSGAGKC